MLKIPVTIHHKTQRAVQSLFDDVKLEADQQDQVVIP